MPSDGRLTAPLMVQLQDDHLRECLWKGTIGQPAANKRTLSSLILCRQKLAHSLGYKSYAHKNLSRKVLTSPEEVTAMLTRLAEKTRGQASRQVSILADMKRKILNIGSTDPVGVYPWDIGHLIHMHGRRATGEDGGSMNGKWKASASQELCQYMSLDTCLAGLGVVCKEVFGIDIEEVEVGAEEHWMGKDSPVVTNGQKTIRKFLLYSAPLNGSSYRGDALGCIYLDPFERGYKFTGASHFTIRCGRRNDHGHSTVSSEDSSGHQLPVVALLFHFPLPSSRAPPLLSLSQLETLYHEWGHAMHSLLSRTAFQHLSGTRGSTDFVEASGIAYITIHTIPIEPIWID